MRIGYSCKYAPLELLAAYGVEPLLLGCGENSVTTGAYHDVRPLHPNLCAFAKELYRSAAITDGVVLVDCCDSIRRVGDNLAASELSTTLLELPHCRDGCGRIRFVEALRHLATQLEALTGTAFDRKRLLAAWSEASANSNAREAAARGPHVALIGARVSPGVRTQLSELVSLPLLDYTCQGARRLAPPPSNDSALSSDELFEAYGMALLDQLPCMRMADVSSRRVLVDDPNVAGVIYSTVKFCDFYPFEYTTLAELLEVPLVKIETEYEQRASEQVLTRINAFNELLPDSPAAYQATSNVTEAAAELPADTAREAGELFAGIDSGSTSTNVVVIDKTGAVRASKSVRTGAKATRSARGALETVAEELGVSPDSFKVVVGTGYGRNHLDFVTRSVTEITCHAKGAHYLDPTIRTIIDIGGQDSKVIVVDESGRVVTFAMNDKCAAGTGRFFEAMANTLEIDLDTMAAMTKPSHAVTLSSLCTVFAESEVIGLIAEDCETSAIVGGLNRSVATRTEALITRAKGKGPYLMTGGVARNRGLVEELTRKLGEPVTPAPDPDKVGALGAALIAAGCLRSKYF